MVQSVLQEGAVVAGHSSTKLTYADYLQFPDDGLRHEIIEGEHYVTPAPNTRHQRIVRNLSYLLQSYLETHLYGEILFAPFDVLLSEFNVLVPDLVFISTARSTLVTAKNMQGAPDLVVEILSPSTKSRDRRLKRDVYERTGVDEYWIIDPDRDVVDVHRREATAFGAAVRYDRTQTLMTPLLPGLALPLDRVLAC
jgi:Uma2 family endonuclease